MKLILLCSIVFVSNSCAKLGYITSQSLEQLRLISTGEKLEEVIKDNRTPKKVKQRLQEIQQYKNYFADYLDEDLGDIYDKVIFLNRESVSHLVISSPWDEIRAIEECFIVVGCFPYLGFFEKKSAIEYRDKMIQAGNSSHIRPVNAYSTLGKFNDRVLSSFFNYSERGLASLIFHELIHSVIFFKNGVSFNENIANFFAEELVREYFGETELEKKRKKSAELARIEIRTLITLKTKVINDSIKSNQSNVDKKHLMKQLLKQEFGTEYHDQIMAICRRHDLPSKECSSKIVEWTPSRLAALGTYNSLRKDIDSYYQSNFNDIRAFYKFLKAKYDDGATATEMIHLMRN